MFTIKAVAPTHYQYNSLRHFGLPITNYNGTFVSEKSFDTIEEARAYLMEVADRYYDDDIHERSDAYESINSPWPCLEIDAVKAIIEESFSEQ
jgi:hypothetical protein